MDGVGGGFKRRRMIWKTTQQVSMAPRSDWMNIKASNNKNDFWSCIPKYSTK
jgi:hypothetical protein